ncbi:MAG: TetR/AcrR family transcriptional regulator [Deltaproteobacteria bacterium]|nr:TetR/AcrR family transcriptional regulator [Deltaproteobacteria bacterium]
MASRKTPARSRRVGRPVRSESADDVRKRLVEVARELFVRRGFGEVGIREIARAAGVTPGMISYYFGGKVGLYEAMLASVFEEMFGRVRELAAKPAEGKGPLASLIRTYIATIADHPWVPLLLLREIVTGDSRARARFIERFASRVSSLLPSLVEAEIARGELRADLDPKLAVLSLLGMSLFPFLAHPLAGKVFGYELDPAFAERLLAHTTQLFFDGARPRAETT